MIDFEWYRSFVAIYQTGTISQAALRRNLTQPAISVHLATLEKIFGILLFNRTPRRMVPTEAGQQLYTQIIASIEHLEALSDPALLRLRPLVHRLRIGAPREYWQSVLLPRMLPNISPHQFSLTFGEAETLIALLEQKSLDVVIATQRIERRLIHYQQLEEERFVLVAPIGWEIPAFGDTATLALWLEGKTWISYAANLPIIRRYWQQMFGRRPKVEVGLVVPDLQIILQMVIAGAGISVLPEYLCAAAQQASLVQYVQPPNENIATPSNQIFIACPREMAQSQAFRWLCDNLAPAT
jgi:DNA-binding transcriptional LysR family regulator